MILRPVSTHVRNFVRWKDEYFSVRWRRGEVRAVKVIDEVGALRTRARFGCRTSWRPLFAAPIFVGFRNDRANVAGYSER